MRSLRTYVICPTLRKARRFVGTVLKISELLYFHNNGSNVALFLKLGRNAPLNPVNLSLNLGLNLDLNLRLNVSLHLRLNLSLNLRQNLSLNLYLNPRLNLSLDLNLNIRAGSRQL